MLDNLLESSHRDDSNKWLNIGFDEEMDQVVSIEVSFTGCRIHRDPDKVHPFISKMSISLPNPMFDNLLESSHRDYSNKWSNIGFGEEITHRESLKLILRTLSSALNTV